MKDFDVLAYRRKQLEEELSIVRNAVNGREISFRDEILGEGTKVDPEKLESLIARMIDCYQDYLEYEDRYVPEEDRQKMEDDQERLLHHFLYLAILAPRLRIIYGYEIPLIECEISARYQDILQAGYSLTYYDDKAAFYRKEVETWKELLDTLWGEGGPSKVSMMDCLNYTCCPEDHIYDIYDMKPEEWDPDNCCGLRDEEDWWYETDGSLEEDESMSADAEPGAGGGIEANSEAEDDGRAEENPGIEEGGSGEENPGIEEGGSGEENSGIEEGGSGEENSGIEEGRSGEENSGDEDGGIRDELAGVRRIQLDKIEVTPGVFLSDCIQDEISEEAKANLEMTEYLLQREDQIREVMKEEGESEQIWQRTVPDRDALWKTYMEFRNLYLKKELAGFARNLGEHVENMVDAYLFESEQSPFSLGKSYGLVADRIENTVAHLRHELQRARKLSWK